MGLKLSVWVRYDAICMERLSQNRRTDRNKKGTLHLKPTHNNTDNEIIGLSKTSYNGYVTGCPIIAGVDILPFPKIIIG